MRARVLSLLVALFVVHLPTLALSCPNCLAGQKNTTALKVVGLFMLVPFGVFAAVVKAVRNVDSRGPDEDRRP